MVSKLIICAPNLVSILRVPARLPHRPPGRAGSLAGDPAALPGLRCPHHLRQPHPGWLLHRRPRRLPPACRAVHHLPGDQYQAGISSSSVANPSDANAAVIYDFKPDLSNPVPFSGSTFSPSLVAQDYAAICGKTYSLSLLGGIPATPTRMSSGIPANSPARPPCPRPRQRSFYAIETHLTPGVSWRHSLSPPSPLPGSRSQPRLR